MRLLFFQSRIERPYPVTSLSCTLIACCAMFGMIAPLTGCGGSDGDSTPSASPSPSPTVSPSPAPVKRAVTFDVTWAARTRGGFNVGSVNSARSAAFSFYENGVRTATPTAVVRVNRDPRNDSYTATYNTGGDTLNTGERCRVVAVFYANPDQVGSVVAGSDTLAVINRASGVLDDNFSLLGAITRIEIAPTIAFVGETTDVVVTTSNQFGQLVPVSPGSITLEVKTGAEIVSGATGTGPLEPLRVVGIRPGTASVVAKVDGATSAAVPVSVSSRAVVTIAPADPFIRVGTQLALSAPVSNLPGDAGPDGQRVLWSVLTPKDLMRNKMP